MTLFACDLVGKFLHLMTWLKVSIFNALFVVDNYNSLQHAQCSHCKRCISYGNSVHPSVCPSVRLSHAGIVSKRRHLARCSLHCHITNVSSFAETRKIFPRHDPFPLKSWLQVTYPLLIAASLDTFCLVAPQRQELAKKVQL